MSLQEFRTTSTPHATADNITQGFSQKKIQVGPFN
jgi:hypothetical protein